MKTFQVVSAIFILIGGLMAVVYFFYRIAKIKRIMGNQHSFASYYISFSDKELLKKMRAIAGENEVKNAEIEQFVKIRKVFLIVLALVLVSATAAQLME